MRAIKSSEKLGDFQVFVTRPISAVIISIAVLLVLMPLAKPALRFVRRRKNNLKGPSDHIPNRHG